MAKAANKDKDWATGKGKIMMRYKPAQTVTCLRIPNQLQDCLTNFIKCFYDYQTGEAVVRTSDVPEIRLFDPMEVFSFIDFDMKVPGENLIKSGKDA